MGFVDDVLGTNIFGANATDRAIGAQTSAAGQAADTQRYMFDQARRDQEPWRQAGGGALNVLMGQLGIGGQPAMRDVTPGGGTVGHGAIRHDGMSPLDQYDIKHDAGLQPGYQSKGYTPSFGGPSGGGSGMGAPEYRSFTMQDFESDPGYQFRLREGQKAIERSAAARGGLNSGATLKALQGYGQDLASQEYQNAYNRFNADQANRYGRYQDYMNRISSLAGLGQTTATNLGNMGMNLGSNLAQTQIGLGNAIGAANIAQADRVGGLAGMGIGALISDERLKTNIRPISDQELTEFRATIKPYFFEYIDDTHGKGEWAGIMAQDLEKSKLGRMAVFEDEHGHKKINLKKLVSILVASQAQGAA